MYNSIWSSFLIKNVPNEGNYLLLVNSQPKQDMTVTIFRSCIQNEVGFGWRYMALDGGKGGHSFWYCTLVVEAIEIIIELDRPLEGDLG